MLRPFSQKIVEEYSNDPRVKVLTGMHRSGKSGILRGIRDYLILKGTAEEDILTIDCSLGSDSSMKNGGAILFQVKEIAKNGHRIFLLFDEVQNLEGWQRSVEMIHESFQCDIYLSGNHSAFAFRGEGALDPATYVEVPLYPLSYREWKSACGKAAADFFRYGNSPALLTMGISEENAYPYLRDVAQSALLTDVMRPKNLRSVDQVMMIFQCLVDNLGRPLSAKVISEILKERGESVGKDTVYSVLRALTDSQLIVKVPRYDLKAKRALEGSEKYYFTDWGMFHAFHGVTRATQQGLLENVVCLEFLSRGCSVYRIQTVDNQIDFLTVKTVTLVDANGVQGTQAKMMEFWQVRASMPEEEEIPEIAEEFPPQTEKYHRHVIVAENGLGLFPEEENPGSSEEKQEIGRNQIGLAGLSSFDQSVFLKMKMQERGVDWVSLDGFLMSEKY